VSESWLIITFLTLNPRRSRPPPIHQVLVSLAHAAVTAEHHKSEKKRSREHLASKLEQGAEIVKAVFSCVFFESQPPSLYSAGKSSD
jgi:hypothetical protein